MLSAITVHSWPGSYLFHPPRKFSSFIDEYYLHPILEHLDCLVSRHLLVEHSSLQAQRRIALESNVFIENHCNNDDLSSPIRSCLVRRINLPTEIRQNQ